jgi:hypothetical protein
MKNELWLADPRFLKDIKRHERKWKTVSNASPLNDPDQSFSFKTAKKAC